MGDHAPGRVDGVGRNYLTRNPPPAERLEDAEPDESEPVDESGMLDEP